MELGESQRKLGALQSELGGLQIGLGEPLKELEGSQMELGAPWTGVFEALRGGGSQRKLKRMFKGPQ